MWLGAGGLNPQEMALLERIRAVLERRLPSLELEGEEEEAQWDTFREACKYCVLRDQMNCGVETSLCVVITWDIDTAHLEQR